jgi:hypothetical protein
MSSKGNFMPTMRVVSREEAQYTRKAKTPSPRTQRSQEFKEYAQALIDNPEQAVVFEDVGDNPQNFVLNLRNAFARAGVPAVVRKMRGRDEVRAWIGDPSERSPQQER